MSLSFAAAIASSLRGLFPLEPALASTLARIAAAVAAAAAGSRLGRSGDAAFAASVSFSGTKSFAKSAIPSRVSNWKSWSDSTLLTLATSDNVRSTARRTSSAISFACEKLTPTFSTSFSSTAMVAAVTSSLREGASPSWLSSDCVDADLGRKK